jgi:hypothetical protein
MIVSIPSRITCAPRVLFGFECVDSASLLQPRLSGAAGCFQNGNNQENTGTCPRRRGVKHFWEHIHNEKKGANLP